MQAQHMSADIVVSPRQPLIREDRVEMAPHASGKDRTPISQY